MRTVLTHCGVLLDAGVFVADVSFDSCMAVTLTLLLSITIPSSVSFLPFPLELS